jgi:hypothetical protein
VLLVIFPIISQNESYFKRITPVCLSVDHVKDLLLHSFTRSISSTPIVPCAHAIFTNEEVFRVVDVLVRSTLYAVDDLESASSISICASKTVLQCCAPLAQDQSEWPLVCSGCRHSAEHISARYIFCLVISTRLLGRRRRLCGRHLLSQSLLGFHLD